MDPHDHGGRRCPVCGSKSITYHERVTKDEYARYWQCMEPHCRVTWDYVSRPIVSDTMEISG
jgi:formate dehydrogenase maturation protein FdhE